ACGADDAVARHNDGNRVAPVGEPDSAGSFGLTDRGRLLAVSPRGAVRDGQQRLPDAFLKRGALRRERQVEFLELAGEIFVQLTARLVEDLILAGWRWCVRIARVLKLEMLERCAVRDQCERADGTVVNRR